VTPQPSADLILGERYRLIEPIAAGGMGTVWRAEDQRLDRLVAVKVLNEGLAEDPRFLERFRREARAAAGLVHPNVAGVFDYGEDGSRPYIVMELVEGETLADRLARRGPLAPEDAARIGAGVAFALAEAHGAGVVHRDIKPANVILSSRGTTKVTDFGIASSARATNLTATGMVMGTARYLSPEQARGEKAGPASDLYALGVLLYEMLTGFPPFALETPVATAMAHVQQEPRPLREVRPEVPAALAAIVDACLAKDPADRPASAAVLAAELRGATRGRPGSAASATSAAAGGAGAAGPGTTEAITREPTAVLPASARTSRGRALRAGLIPLVVALLVLGTVALAARLGTKPPPQVAVPSFDRMTRSQAVARADRSGLELTFSLGESDVTKGLVIGQQPVPGARLSHGGTVHLILSKGPPMTTVPSLIGMSTTLEVLATLEQNHLAYGGVRNVPGEAGIVGTDPPEGTSVPYGTRVVILVGEGKDHGKGDKHHKDEGGD
jgi:serine/threonine-protein kinase